MIREIPGLDPHLRILLMEDVNGFEPYDLRGCQPAPKTELEAKALRQRDKLIEQGFVDASGLWAEHLEFDFTCGRRGATMKEGAPCPSANRAVDLGVYPLASEVRMNDFRGIVLTISACVLLAGSVAFSHQQGELAGIRGIPVAGHDTIAAIEIVGTSRLSGFQNMRDRFRSNGAELRLGFPLESQTLCRFKEVLRDLMREKGYPDADISHERKPTYGNPGDITLVFTVVEGKRTSHKHAGGPLPTPAERCSR
jgi:hypothetical protein